MKDLYFAFLTLKPLTGSSETDFFCSVKKQRGLSWLREIKLFLLISALSCSHVCLPSSIIFLKLFPLLHTPCPCTHFPSSLWKNKRRKCLSCPSLPLVVEAGAWQGRDTHTHTQPGPAPLHSKAAWAADGHTHCSAPASALVNAQEKWRTPKGTSKTTSRAFKAGNIDTGVSEFPSFLRIEVLDTAVLWEISVLRINCS